MTMGVWQGVAMDSLKFPEMARWQPVVVFYPFGHPTLYAYAKGGMTTWMELVGLACVSFAMAVPTSL
jgi:hypothetical protein